MQPGQLDERLLHHVLGRVAPLPRVQGERGGVVVHQKAELVRSHTPP
jgi:hypothetical protein